MTTPCTDHDQDLPDVQSLLLLVVGAGIEAELSDRMLAYRLRERILKWQDAQGDDLQPLHPVVCTDLWYLNTPDLMARPTLSIGPPERNAATAYLANRVPTAFVIDETLRVQLDLEFIDLHGSLWGVNHAATVSSVDLFAERYLEAYLQAAHDADSP